MSLHRMSESLPKLMENSIQIAWDDLEKTGEITDAQFASRFLMDKVDGMIRQGERRRLILSNRAIAAYQRFISEKPMTLV